MTTQPSLSRRTFLTASATAVGAGLASLPYASVAQSTQATSKTPLYGPPPGVAKLNANENPYGPSPAAIKAMTEAITKGAYYVNDAA